MLLGTIRRMRAGYGERWIELCDEALKEEDSTRLIELIQEINNVIEQKQRYSRIKIVLADPPLNQAEGP